MAREIAFKFKSTELLEYERVLYEMKAHIRNRMRTEPMRGMKQPCPLGAMMGLETAVTILDRGRPAAGYRWRLLREGKQQRRGSIGTKGEVILPIPLSDEADYVFLVVRP